MQQMSTPGMLLLLQLRISEMRRPHNFIASLALQTTLKEAREPQTFLVGGASLTCLQHHLVYTAGITNAEFQHHLQQF